MPTDFMLTVQPDPKLLAFVLGAQSFRISIHTQQLRAAKLAAQLSQDAEFAKAKNAAVIGAGAAGVTLALALAAQGKTVSLFEKSARLIPLQYNNHSRYLHPFSVNWPQKDFSPTTELPYLNWYADYSNDVAKRLYEKYYGIKSALNLQIEEEKNSAVHSCRVDEGRDPVFELTWGEDGRGAFDSLFITDGFGIENKISAYDNFSYWEDSSVVPKRTFNPRPRIAVIGDGDGALIDVARCIYSHKDLERIYDGITRFWTTKDFRRAISQIDQALAFDRKRELPDNYYELVSKAVCRPEVDRFLGQFEENDCQVTLISTSYEGLSYNASNLNKFLYLFLRLKRPKKVLFVRARAATIKMTEDKGTNTFTFSIDPSKAPIYSNNPLLFQKPIRHFDRVLERLGPGPYNKMLLSGVFLPDVLDDFFRRNSAEFSFANPTDLEQPEIEALRQKFTEANWVSEGSNDLLDYIQEVTGGILDKGRSQVGYNLGKRVFEVAGLVLPETIVPKAVAGKGGRSRIADLPKKWYGKPLLTSSIRREDLRKDRDVYGISGNAQFGIELTEPLFDYIPAGQRIQLCQSDLPQPPDGRIAYFVKRRGQSTEVFGLAPRHVLQNAKSNMVVCAVGKGNEQRAIGDFDKTVFEDKILAETKNGNFSCLGDVALIDIDDREIAINRIDDIKLSRVASVYDYAVNDGGVAYSGNRRLGTIKKVFNHVSVGFPIGEPVPVETFVVECDQDVDVNSVISGSTINTMNGAVLGMAVGSESNNLYCLESFKIHNKLGLDLI